MDLEEDGKHGKYADSYANLPWRNIWRRKLLCKNFTFQMKEI